MYVALFFSHLSCAYICSLVSTLREHKSWVVTVHMQLHTAARSIVSACGDGDVKVWDPRFTQSIRSLSCLGAGGANVCEIHPRAPLLAAANQAQGIRVANLDTDEVLSHIRYHEGFMGQKIGATRCLAFHPYRVSTGTRPLPHPHPISPV